MTIAAVAEHWQRRDTRVSVSRALGSATRAAIYEHLREAAEPLTVRDVSLGFDVHPNVARTHLEMLADAGLVVVGHRKHAGGGRPAKIYRVADAVSLNDVAGGEQAAARLQVRLLTEIADSDGAPERDVDARAYDVASAEGRRLAGALATADADGLSGSAQLVVQALRPHVPGLRVIKETSEWIDVAGVAATFGLLASVRPDLAEALQRGLIGGSFAAAGQRVNVAGAGTLPDGDQVWRVRRAAAGVRAGPRPARRVDARPMPREQGVVRAMREVTGMGRGEVLEVLAEGPGAPAAFARWADRAGHELLGVDRATDDVGRPAIRLLIRKGG